MVRTRMLEVVKVLENFKELAEGTSRTDYTNRLLKIYVNILDIRNF